MKNNSEIWLLTVLLCLLSGCFPARKYAGASRNAVDAGISYAFKSRDYRKGTSINVDRWWKVQANADSCLTDDYIRKFFKLENGNIVPRYDKMVNRETWLNKTYDLDMGDYKVPDSAYLWLQINLITNSKFVTWDEEQEVWYIQRFGGKIDASINGDGGENLGVEKIVNYDEDGNIEKITYWTFYRPLSGSECLFENGSGYYVNADFIETVDTLMQNVNAVQLPRPRAGYDENGYFFLNHRRALNDSMTVVTRIQAYAAEEGQVENNCKVGEWKYRDSAGELVRTQHYRLQDKVDVRFPHRYFNKRRFR